MVNHTSISKLNNIFVQKFIKVFIMHLKERTTNKVIPYKPIWKIIYIFYVLSYAGNGLGTCYPDGIWLRPTP